MLDFLTRYTGIRCAYSIEKVDGVVIVSFDGWNAEKFHSNSFRQVNTTLNMKILINLFRQANTHSEHDNHWYDKLHSDKQTDAMNLETWIKFHSDKWTHTLNMKTPIKLFGQVNTQFENENFEKLYFDKRTQALNMKTSIKFPSVIKTRI